MDPFYQIENNIPSNAHTAGVRVDKSVLYAFVKGPYPNHMDLDNLTADWSLRGWNSRSAESPWGNESNGWRNWSFYFYQGPLESRPLAESILNQHFNTLKSTGQITDFRIRQTFVDL